MSKHNKKKNRPEPLSQSSVNRIFEPAAKIVDEAPKEIETEKQPKMDEIRSKIVSLGGSESKFSEDEKNSFKQLLNYMKDAVEAYKQAKEKMETKNSALESLSKNLSEKERNFEGRENALASREKELENKEKSFNNKENDIAAREVDISRREAEANAGFIAKEMKWKDEATRDFEEKIKSIKDGLEQEKNELREKKIQLDGEQIKNREREGSYNSKEAELRKTKERVEEEKETAIKEIKDKYKEKVDELERDYGQEKDRLKKRNEELQNQISQFNDIRAELGGHSAAEINKIIEALKNENDQLKLDLQNIGSVEYQQELEEKVQQNEVERERLVADNNRLKKQLERLKNEVVDVDGLRAINKTLETHNEALKEVQNQLRNELNELTSKDKDKEIFAEFKGIDDRCAISYSGFTVSDGNLKTFVNAVGYRMTQYTPNLYYTPEVLQLFVGGLAMSRLILLQGISGTGKTKLAQAFSSIVGDNLEEAEHDDNLERCSCVVPVQSGWRDNQDLLGYYNAFEKKFYEKAFSKGLYAASTPAFKERLFFLILDEMNLSHPEQYFADFISAMEQSNSVSDSFDVDLLTGISKEIIEDKKRWPRFLHNEKIVVPSNVWFIGTANHDETTMEFADKTYDRAHIMIMDRNIQRYSWKEVPKGAAHWSASDLRDVFYKAQNSTEGKSRASWVKGQLDSLKDILEKEFDVSFGNRLERQVENFVPVVCAAGGTRELALDHLIATKIIRRGKITGLFGVQKESLENLRDEIQNNLGLKENSQTIKLLNRDIVAKERGA